MREPRDGGVNRGGIGAEEAWAAVVARDPAYEGAFVYAVATTGIYCRPGCAARRPLRTNVTFYAGPPEAEAAGFRACRRCHPGRDHATLAAACVERARAYLEAHLARTVTLEELGRAAHMSPFHLQRTFRRLQGVSPREYVRARRAELLRARLREGDTVSRATFEAGFPSASRVYERDGVELGMTPGAYRRGGRGEVIRFAVVAVSHGSLLVAATERGVCAVALGDGDEELVRGLEREFPAAELRRAEGELREAVATVAALADGHVTAQPLADVPLDLRGTVFQRRVWDALRRIPAGETRSYAQVAAEIGAPTAVRAVAQACARNPAALVVPCHRVVRADLAPSGYRWGAERKRALLEQEGAVDPP